MIKEKETSEGNYLLHQTAHSVIPYVFVEFAHFFFYFGR